MPHRLTLRCFDFTFKEFVVHLSTIKVDNQTGSVTGNLLNRQTDENLSFAWL